MQLAIAIIFIVILMNIWVDNVAQDQKTVNEHFNYISDQYLNQVNAGVLVLLAKKNNKALQQYIENLAQKVVIQSIFLYSASGELIAHAGNKVSVKALYGLAPNARNKSKHYVPFMSEVRTNKVQGYIRIDMNKEAVVSVLAEKNRERQQLIRFMLIIAGLVGFFLTRGLSRFSRQGFRVAAGK